MPDPSKRPYAILVVAWLIVSGLGCLAGAVADGADSILPNFLKYGLGGGAVVAALLGLAYLADRRLHRRAGLLDDEQENPRDR